MGLSQTNSNASIPAEEAIPLYVSSIPACWRLYFDGELLEVANVLPSYISHLSILAQQTSKYGETTAGLLSQAHQLGYLLELQDQNFKVAQTHAQQALHYAEITHDPNLRGSSLIRLGNLSYTLKRPTQTVQKYLEAVQYIGSASPLLQAQAHIGLAEALARIGDEKEAILHQRLAREILPGSPEKDPHYAYTHFNNFTITNFEGLMYLHLNQPRNAWDTFTQVDKDIPNALVPQRVELMNRQTTAALALGDMHRACDNLELAIPSALTLGSDLRYNEACETYEHMQAKWPQEKRVKELVQLLHG